MNDSPLQVLQTSQDPKALSSAAMALARSKRSEDHDTLLDFLRRPEFLKRLDSEADYRAAPSKRLRISRVLEALGTNDTRSAHEVLVMLSGDETFLGDENRIDAIIRASAEIRPPPPKLIAFWDAYSKPEDGFSHLTVPALIKNGTEPALQLLERKMADPNHPDDDKIAWMRTDILVHRNDLLLLKSCERMLSGGLPRNLLPFLVEALFDYRPQEWYRPASAYNPPDLRKASSEAQQVLRRIGHLVLRTVSLTNEQKTAVETTLRQLEGQ